MLREGGYQIIVDPDPPRGTPAVQESSTFTCIHCQYIVQVRPGASAASCGGWCGRCAAPICTRCVASGRCEPWEAQMEKIEARARFLRSAGL